MKPHKKAWLDKLQEDGRSREAELARFRAEKAEKKH